MMDVDKPPRRSSRKRSIIQADPANTSRPPKKPKTQAQQQETKDDTPTSYLRIYCLGSNDNGELGLGAGHGIGDVRVPTLNPFLSWPFSPPDPPSKDDAKKASPPPPTIKNKVTQLATGGMHSAALTTTNEILTWGVNDNGALGRDTSSARLEELIHNLTLQDDHHHHHLSLQNDDDHNDDDHNDDDHNDDDHNDDDHNDDDHNDDDNESDFDLNILEAKPHPVLFFDGTATTPTPPSQTPQWKALTACDSATFALSSTGQVYGWGCTRSSQGISLWTPHLQTQPTPAPIPLDEPIRKIAAGGNHVLALTDQGQVYTWGAGCEQGQLGRRLPQRGHSLLSCAVTPRKIKLKNIVDIATGPDHCFAVGKDGEVWGWGLDNYGQTGVSWKGEGGGCWGLFVEEPTRVKNLEEIVKGGGGRKIKRLAGGNSHSLCLLDDGSVWSWGRVDSCATGVDLEGVKRERGEGWEEEWVVKDSRGRARIVLCPVRILPQSEDEHDRIRWVEAGAEHGVAVTEDGRVLSWGFNLSHQTGHRGEEEVKVPRVVGMKGKLEGVKFSWAGAGGHFTMLGEEVGL
ncbi:regulator of chromosome condensation 1/beta-lactamase-inhibitor protein II [Cercophora samala]|uniref:Regulator of chromosome condensation 1/beta-lactamase-inhibitor protein II n=1 Tax=Cercophora samala TaxID=330535 RepID=A0AA39ZMU3_9PEZI|nr:regulator of chromosome condensation 1/beta-lactamase-inhibitor protein II [Cercophora samala]